MNKTSGQKEVDVWIQDQTTPPFHRFFMTEDKTDIILTSPISKDDTVINVSAGHGFVFPSTPVQYMLINYGNYIQQSKVTGVSTNAITIESPVGIDLPISGCQIIRGIICMNINGDAGAGGTETTYYCRIGANASPVDIQHLQVFMRDGSDGDQSTYGGITALTNGTFVRLEDGVDQNLGLYKANIDFVQFGAHATYNDKAPSGEYSFDFSFDMKETYGVVFRLDQSTVLKCVIRDNLTGLIEHKIVAIGQTTLGE